MRSRRSPRFRRELSRLPAELQSQARDAYRLFAEDPFHESLHFKQLNSRGLWSARVGEHYRALGWRAGDLIVWAWIGSHADYDQLVRRLR